MTASGAAADAPQAGPIAVPWRTFTANGVRLERLRAGQAGAAPVFMVPGLEGEHAELRSLTSALTGPQAVYAMSLLLRDSEQQPILSIERAAELMLSAIREVQPSGPYRLGGYSFGALIALEMAQQLRAVGDGVEALFLIEPVYDERYWPRGIWLRALCRRTGRHLVHIAQSSPANAVGELRVRGVRLMQRVRRRNPDALDPLGADPTGEGMMRHRARSAIAGYRPRFFDGQMTLIVASTDRHFGCDPVRLWDGYARRVDVQRVNADHVTIMHEAAAPVVASVIDHRLSLIEPGWTGLRPTPGFERPLILTTVGWFSTARLTHALTEAGFAVSACRPKGHALGLVDGLTSDVCLSRTRPLRSLVTAIRQARPDIILPDDEHARSLLRRLHSRTEAVDPEIAALVERSLGNIDDWPTIGSRAALADEAVISGVSTPATRVIEDADALETWAAEQSLPVVLKTDGSWGGRGVAVVRRASDLRQAWRRISRPPRMIRAITRTLLKSDANSLAASVLQKRPVVNAQQFVDGREAIATVACVDGRVLAIVCFEVLQTSLAKGPAAMVRIIEHPAMAAAARRLVDRFGLSGFCGFDFMLADDGRAQLLELNARVTPTCHLLLEGDYSCSRTIRLFPTDPVPGTGAGIEASDVIDRPVRAPLLIHAGEQMAARKHRPLSRAVDRLTKKFNALPY